MAGFVGKNLYATFGTSVLTGSFREFTETEEQQLVDSTAGNAAGMSYLATVYDGNATFSSVLPTSAAGTALWLACARGTEGTLIWAESGTASGSPKHTVTALVRNRTKEMPYNNVVMMRVTFQFSSDILDSTY